MSLEYSSRVLTLNCSRLAYVLLPRPWRLYTDRIEFTLVAVLWICWTCESSLPLRLNFCRGLRNGTDDSGNNVILCIHNSRRSLQCLCLFKLKQDIRPPHLPTPHFRLGPPSSPLNFYIGFTTSHTLNRIITKLRR